MADPSWSREPAESDRTLEENWLFRLRRERFRSRLSGLAHDFYVMHLADAVNVIALTPERRLVLVRQFRAGSGKDSLETPGGLLEPGEDPLVAGARELLEETGYAGDPPVLVGAVWSNPSIMTSRITTILITNVRRTAAPSLDHGEEVRVEFAPARAVPRLIRDGQIDHALAVQGLLWWLAGEIPGTPLHLEVRRPRRVQWRIASLLYLVAACAVGFAFLSRLSPGRILGIAGVIAFPGAALITLAILDPLPNSILLRPMSRPPRRYLLRMLAVFGLTVVLAVGIYLVAMM